MGCTDRGNFFSILSFLCGPVHVKLLSRTQDSRVFRYFLGLGDPPDYLTPNYCLMRLALLTQKILVSQITATRLVVNISKF